MLRLSGDAAQDEVNRARAQLKAGTLMSLESSASRAEQLARQTLVFGRQIPVEELIERIDAVDVAAVRRVAGRISSGGEPAVAAMGPIAGLASRAEIAARFAKG